MPGACDGAEPTPPGNRTVKLYAGVVYHTAGSVPNNVTGAIGQPGSNIFGHIAARPVGFPS